MKPFAVDADAAAFRPAEGEELAELIGQLCGRGPAAAGDVLGVETPAHTPPELASQAFFDALSLARVGIVHRAMDGRLLAANDYYCELLDRSREELGTLTLADYAHSDDIAPLLDLYSRGLVGAEPFQREIRHIRPDGEERRCIVQISFLCDAGGVPASSLAVVLDVTARYEAEAQLFESAAHHRNRVELAPLISWTALPDGSIEEVSPRWEGVTGIDPASALGQGWVCALRDEDVEPTLAAWANAIETRHPIDIEYRLRTKGGEDRWFRARATPRLDPAGEVIRWYGTLEDIDDRKRTEQALRESEERFRLAAQAAGLGVWDFDAVHQRREWSIEFKTMLGLAPDAEPLVETALALVVPEDRYLLSDLIAAVRAGKSEHRFEVMVRIRRADTGAERWMQTSGWRIEAPNGHLDRVLVTIRDVTEQRNAEERVRWTANHDALTGLPNRGFFNEQLGSAIRRAESDRTKLGLVLFDIDNLKETNDTIGHDAGDTLLQTAARRLHASLGSEAFLARLGGDEFAAFLQVDDEADLIDIVDAALRSLRAEFDYDGGTLTCPATAGAAIYPRDGQSANDILKTADIALYAGKAAKRGMLSVFKPAMRADVQRRASMLAVARRVISDDRVGAWYQPKVALADGSLIGVEALLRWRHDTLGVQGPDLLAAAFEDMNLATAIGERMLDRICGDVSRWRDAGLEFGRVAINLSPAEFKRDDLFDRVMGRLHRSGIPPSLLELEVTETVFLGRGAEMVGDALAAFHREGVSIALDDFGTGYASLTHLQAFPVDVIKIDRSFVSDLSPRSGNPAIVDAVIGLATRLDIQVIAEGIETPAQADYLIQRGCAFGQGFLYSRAVAPDALRQLLSARTSLLPRQS